ncbi:MAG: recombinase family protein [Lachnospiraceae bacterium]
MTNKPSANCYHAAIYLRLSREDGDVTAGSKNESNSIVNQKNLILDFLKDKDDIQVVSIREDDGYSGVDFNRPGFQLMLQDIKKGIIDCIIVKDLSRFGRNYIEVGRYLEKLFPILGVRFIAVNDNYDSLHTDTVYDLVMPFKNLINDAYCRDLSVKIRSHLAIKRKNGEFIGAFACYGYLKDPQNKHKLIIDSYAGSVVQNIFRMKINGYSQYKIADILNKQGILSPMEYKRSIGIHFETSFKVNPKALWSAKAVSRILTNEVYTGVLVQGKQTTPNHKVKIRRTVDAKDWIRIEHAHPPLIHPDLFDIVQILMERDTRTSPKAESVFPLAGLLYCGDCGQPMIRKTTSYSSKDSKALSSQTYAYFVCQGQCTNQSCSWHRICEKDLLDAVLQAVNFHMKNLLDSEKALSSVDTVPSVPLLIQKYKEHISRKETELRKVEKLKMDIYEDLKEGLLNKAEYLKLKNEFEQRMEDTMECIQNLYTELTALQENHSPHDAWLHYFQKFHKLEKLTRWAAAIMINRILVYEDTRIKIIFNFQDTFVHTSQLVYGQKQKESV